MIPSRRVDVVVVGAGPAGLAAAASAKEAGASEVLLLERDTRVGGVLNQCIHDGFGTKVFNEALTGPEYAAIYAERVDKAGVELMLETSVVDLDDERNLTIFSKRGAERIDAGSVILAMGCRERSRGAIGIPGTRPAGVYTAGTAQTFMNVRGLAVGRRVVILGSGDIGLIMARRLTLEGAEVVCVAEILPYPSGLARNIVQCLDDYNIPLYLNTTAIEIHGDRRITGVTLAEVGPRGGIRARSKRRIACDTLLLSVGLIPENEITRGAGAEMSTATNGPVVDDSYQTSVPGVFACGNVLQVHDLVDYATLEAERAGRAATQFAEAGALPEATIPVQAGNGVRYVLPSRVSGRENVDFTMRVREPAREKAIVFSENGRVVRRLRQQALAPASMARVRLGRGRFSQVHELSVEIGE